MRSAGRTGTHPARRAAIRGVLFDVDGTLLLSDRALGGYELLPGAIEVLSALKARRVPFALLTNGSAYPPAEQAAKLRAAGLAVDDGQMITSSAAASNAPWCSALPGWDRHCAMPVSRRCTRANPVRPRSGASTSAGIPSVA